MNQSRIFLGILALAVLPFPAMATLDHVWYMNEGTGTTIADSGVVGGVDLTMTGPGSNPTWTGNGPSSTGLAPSAASNSLTYTTGGNSLVWAGDTLSENWDYTIEMWIKPTATTFDSTYRHAFSTGYMSTTQLDVLMHGYDLILGCYWWNGASGTLANVFNADDVGQWIHLAVVSDGNETMATTGRIASIYKDGTFLGTIDTGDYPGSFTNLTIGSPGLSDGTSTMDGTIGAVAWSSGLLSPGEFALLVPEPATMALLCVGGVLALMRRRV